MTEAPALPTDEFPAPSTPVTILFIDPGTGKGGASRSLLFLVSNLDRARWRPVVVMLESNPLAETYRADGVTVETLPQITRFVPGQRKNIIAFGLFLLRLRSLRPLMRLVERYKAECPDLILHANHENLALPAHFLSKKYEVPWICHIRTTLFPTFSARTIYRFINRRATHTVFIADGVKKHFEKLAGEPSSPEKSTIVYNPYQKPEPPKELLELVDDPGHTKFRVLTLSHITPNRGIHRQLEVAKVLKERGVTDILIIIAGGANQVSLNPLSQGGYYEQILARAEEEELTGIVKFIGHITPPEKALNACDALIKLSPENSPWGRDMIEAIAHGLPVITIGSERSVVEHEVNGMIDHDYDPETYAGYLMRLRDEPGLLQTIRANNMEKAARMFAPPVSANALDRIYRRLLAAR